MAFVTDSFTEASDTTLASHTGEVGATWTLRSTLTAIVKGATDRLEKTEGTTGSVLYHASGVPAGVEYDVYADFIAVDISKENQPGITGRYSTSAATFYLGGVQGTHNWDMWRVFAGSWTALGSYTQTLVTGTTYAVHLEIRDAAKKFFVGGVERISSADNTITAANQTGLRFYMGAANEQGGWAIDNFSAVDIGGQVFEVSSIDGMFIGDAAPRERELIVADGMTMDDAPARARDHVQADAALLLDTLLRSAERSELTTDAVLLQTSIAREQTYEIVEPLLLQALMSREQLNIFSSNVLLADEVFYEKFKELVVTDTFLLADDRLSTMDRELFESILIADMAMRAVESIQLSGLLLLDDSALDIIRALLDVLVIDGLLLQSALVREQVSQRRDSLLLADAAFSELFALLLDRILVRDDIMRDRLLDATDALLLRDITERAQELLYAEGILIRSDAITAYIEAMGAALIWARIRSRDPLGARIAALDPLGMNVDARDPLGISLNAMQRTYDA